MRTKRFSVPLVSFATKSLARLSNATTRPSALIRGGAKKSPEGPLPLPVPARFTLARVVVPVFRSRTFQRALRIPSFALFEFLDGISIHLLGSLGDARPAESLLHAPPPRKSHGAAQAGILQDA